MSSSGRTTGWGATLLAFGAALVFFGATRQGTVFSDGLWLATMVENDPAPHYNALYLPLGGLLHRLAGSAWNGDALVTLGWLSVVCGAAGVAVVERSLARLELGPGVRGTCLVLLIVTPSLWFFATVAEVHGLQFLGAACATHLALVAREASARRAILLVVLAAALLVATHLTALLAVPGIVWLALGGGPDRGPRPRVTLADLLPALVVGVLLIALVFGLARRGAHAEGDPWHMALLFAGEFGRRLGDSGFFGPGEVLDFLGGEFVAPAALLLVGAGLGLFLVRRGGLRTAAALALAPYLVLLPQGGIREEGGYFVSLLPLLTLLGACAWESLARGGRRGLVLGGLAILVLVQGGLGWQRRERLGRAGDPRAWRAELDQVCPPGSYVYTSSLPRWHVLAEPPPLGGVDLARELQMVPRGAWDAEIRTWLDVGSAVLAGEHRLFFDADLLRGAERPEAWGRLGELLRGFPVVLVGRPGDDPIVFEAIPSAR